MSAENQVPESVIKMLTETVSAGVSKQLGELIEEKMKKANEEKAKAEPAFDLKGLVAQKFKGEKPEDKPNIGRAIRYLCAGGGNVMAAAEIAHKAGDAMIAKALGESTLAGGGALLPVEFSSEVTEALRAKSVMLEADMTVLPMNTGSLLVPYVNTGATAAWVGENSNITSSQPTFGQMQLRDHKLAVVTPTSNDLLRNGGAAVERVIKNDITRAMQLKLDATLIRSVGSQNEPMGMRYMAASGQAVDANATVNLSNVVIDLGKCVQRNLDNDVDISACQWRFSHRTWRYLYTLTNSNGEYVFKSELDNKTLYGFPFKTTSQIPNNVGGTSVGSEVYFVSFPDLVFARNERLMVEVFPNGAYYDGSSVISGISQDQSVVRAILLCDFGARFRGKEISIITDARWS